MAANVDDIVDTPPNPVVAVVVSISAIASKLEVVFERQNNTT